MAVSDCYAGPAPVERAELGAQLAAYLCCAKEAVVLGKLVGILVVRGDVVIYTVADLGRELEKWEW